MLSTMAAFPSSPSAVGVGATTTATATAATTTFGHQMAHQSNLTIVDEILTNRTIAELVLGTLTYIVIISMTVGGNILVVISVFNYRPLKKVQNYFLVSLAAADLAVAILVMPLHVVKFLAGGRWILGSVICQMFTTLDILCCTSSILNLCAIAMDRYWAIHNPIEYAQKRTLKLVGAMIVLVWLASALISIPPLIGWNDWTDTGKLKERCELTTEKAFVLFSASGSFFIPLAIMTSVYVKIFVAARQRIRTNRGRSALMKIPPDQLKGDNGNATARANTKNSAGDGSHSQIAESVMTMDPPTADGCSGLMEQYGSPMHCGGILPAERTPLVSIIDRRSNIDNSIEVSPLKCNQIPPDDKSSEEKISEDEDGSDERRKSKPRLNRFLKPHSTFSAVINGKILERASMWKNSHKSPSPTIVRNDKSRHSAAGSAGHKSASEALQKLHAKDTTTSLLKRREKISVAKEKKAAKTLAVIMGVFVLCWLPFFLMYVIMPFCESCWLHPKVVEAITWLGYINSAINPVIYTIFNLDFRRAFEKFLCPKSVRTKRRFSNARGAT